ncbi:hypothetical protein [Methylobacterium dankookense]|uniref:Uncharacterized protein n=1 Tax=Methylobacterium dankookense TaxID=560405 RepID=A0A564FUK0_9HYPH|nr:hypothetical protein [Methylobacterium dankookense]GJD56729.1 hypothetical protein IFDJLNFL_2626 [Methylobacterium dankookense]VUF11763.1 hypothetical protein MTDSW087_01447 [Methylobacterium dankookense]
MSGRVVEGVGDHEAGTAGEATGALAVSAKPARRLSEGDIRHPEGITRMSYDTASG